MTTVDQKIVKRGKGTIKQCPVCGSDYFASFSKLQVGRAKFCSPQCSFKGRPRPEWTGANNPAWKGGGGASGATKRYRLANPEKIMAHFKLQYAVRTGAILKPPCEECGATKNVHGHHEDYSKPLDVRWLCYRCHLKQHDRAAAQP